MFRITKRICSAVTLRRGLGVPAIAGTLSLLVAVSAFVLAEGVNSTSSAAPSSAPSGAPLDVSGWEKVAWKADWLPTFANADLRSQQSYARNGDTVDLFIATYSRQGPGQKMITYDNRIIDEAAWSIVSKRPRSIGGETLPLSELVVSSVDRRRYVWFVYWLDGTFTADPLVATLLEIKAKLFFGDQRAAIVAVSTADPKAKATPKLPCARFCKTRSPQSKPFSKLPHAPHSRAAN